MNLWLPVTLYDSIADISPFDWIEFRWPFLSNYIYNFVIKNRWVFIGLEISMKKCISSATTQQYLKMLYMF